MTTVPAIEVGRICVKVAGREDGHRCVIVDLIDKNFVLTTGPKEITGVKRRRVNVSHLEPTERTVKIERGASDGDVAKAIKAEKQTEEMKKTVKPKF